MPTTLKCSMQLTMYRWVRALLFLLPAELTHAIGLWAVRWSGRLGFVRRRLRRLTPDLPELACQRFGLQFPSPLGLAAGMDKDGTAAAGFFALGFGFVEVGTVTPRRQRGNPRPRLFRAVADEAIVNRMGFNNRGATAAARRLWTLARPGPLGLNIGCNKNTPEDGAAADYLAAARAVRQVADYIVVNVSSPNTPGLRDLQRAERLRPLLTALRADVPERPLLLKFAPDLGDDELFALCDVALETGVAGLIATNTTLWRPSTQGAYGEAGGMSGRPLAARAERALALAYGRVGARLPLVGVGGLVDAASFLSRLRAGASLLQAYSAVVYGGPGWARASTLDLARLLRSQGYRSVDEAVGHNAVR